MKSKIVMTVPRETKARWVSAAQGSGMKLTDWIVASLERTNHDPHHPLLPPEPSYTERIEKLGGRPAWAEGLSSRAALALMREGWTRESLLQAVSEGMDLMSIGNVGRKTAAEIQAWLEDTE